MVSGKDFSILQTGVIGLWQNPKNGSRSIAFRIDKDYYKSRNIEATDVIDAFNKTLEKAIEELLAYSGLEQIKLTFEELIELRNGYVPVRNNGETYYIAFSNDYYKKNISIIFEESSILPHEDFKL